MDDDRQTAQIALLCVAVICMGIAGIIMSRQLVTISDRITALESIAQNV